MSASPSRSQRVPLRERSQSQANTLAIRVVPYSPPRPDADQRHPSDPTRRVPPVESGAHCDRDTTTVSEPTREPSRQQSVYASNRLPALLSPTSSSSSTNSTLSATRFVLAKEGGVSGSKPVSDSKSAGGSSAPTTPVASTPSFRNPISQVYASSTSQSPDEEQSQRAKNAAQRSWPPRRRNFVAVHSDKTFSLLPHSDNGRLASSSLSLSTASSHERLSSDAFSDDRPSSPMSNLAAERSVSPYTPGSSSTQLIEDHIGFSSSSPWNYRMIGGLRKVPKTPDLKQKGSQIPASSSSDLRLHPLPEAPTTGVTTTTPSLLAKASFQSSQTTSTTSETTNYKVFGSSSPVLSDTYSLAPSSSHSNYELLGASSSPAPSIDQQRPHSADSNENYVLYGAPSSSPSGSLVTVKSRVRPQYSQESLVVPPLRPAKKSSLERLGYYRSRSRESLRAGSLTSISTVLTQEATQALFAAPTSIYLHGNPLAGWRQDKGAGSSASTRTKLPMQAHPHQWSSQLSTVASESEVGSALESRSVSPASGPGRYSSSHPSNHSRQMLSISSSLAGLEERSRSRSRSHSRSDSLDRPLPTFARGGAREPVVSTVRLVRDQDEHGDGLTDLHALQQRPSRNRLSGFFSNASSDRNLHSSASSRANSLGSSSLPAWARFYYGSGERRFLAASSESMISEFSDSRPPSSFRSGSPTAEHFPLSIYSPRRRVREVNPATGRPLSDVGSMEIGQAPPFQGLPGPRGLRKQTSSIWSPHLRYDRRASRYSIWEPPSVNWSAESGILGRRNIQVVLFLFGFIFPFAWMIAAFLPLPPSPQPEMMERDHRASLLDFRTDLTRRARAIDEMNFNSAKWWRQLNRYMSVIGLLVLGAVVALVVVGIRQGWARNP